MGDQAVDSFFSEGLSMPAARAPAPVAVDAKKVDAFFRRYKAPDADAINSDGIQQLCADLNISPMDPVTLVLSYHCRAEQMGVFTREEFVGGMQRLGCDSLAKLFAKLEELRGVLQDRVAC